MTLIDTRTTESFEQWHIQDAKNVPFNPSEWFDEGHESAVRSIANDDPVTVICGKGLTSTPFGIQLDDRGFDEVSVVRGGMEAWCELYNIARFAGDGAVIYQLQRRATGCLSYVIASEKTGVALIVDPTRQRDVFTSLIARERLSVAAVIDTHLHADHLSGGPELADELGIPYRLGAHETANHRYDSLEDGGEISLNGVLVTTHHAPGHTGEMANIVVNGTFVLSSDSLLLDSVGRTELGFGVDGAENGAKQLYETIHRFLLELNSDPTVLPGHISISNDLTYENGSPGQPIGRSLSTIAESVDLIGTDRESFIEKITTDLPQKPRNYERIVAINAGNEQVELEAEAAALDSGANNCSA